MITLIGSTAAKHWFEDFRLPKDTDYHSDAPVEIAGADVFIDSRLGQWDWKDIATPEELYTMKVSHSFWEINRSSSNWDKHMYDVLFYQKKGIPFVRELYDILLPIWKDIHAPNITNLNQSAKNFFDDAVNRKYDHDSVHESIAYYDRPLYESILKDGSDVMVDNSKFWAMDHDTQMKLIREEVYATALERIVIPADYKVSPTFAYHWALRRTITSLFKGEWALHTVLNYTELVRPDCDYIKRHLSNKHKLIELEK